EALRRLSRALHDHGMGLIVDVVPNHMAIPTPAWHNRALWSVLRDGPGSPFADWFDLDPSGERSVLVPVLGRPIGAVLADEEISTGTAEIPQPDGSVTTEPVVRYYDHVLPIAAGTEHLGLADLLDRQFYRLAYWKVSDEELNYRRFFAVETLAAVPAELPHVVPPPPGASGQRAPGPGRPGGPAVLPSGLLEGLAGRAELPPLLRRGHAGGGAGRAAARVRGAPGPAAAPAGRGVIDGYRIDHPDG